MKRLILALLVLTSLGLAQREDTVYANVFVATDVNPSVSSPVRNIGQSSHILEIILNDNGGNTCLSPSTISVGLEYSYDNVTYVRAANQITQARANLDGIIFASQNVAGAYPYVRVNLRDFDDTNCVVTANYSGAVSAFNVNAIGASNSFLGIYAVSTLNSANPGINLQLTPSQPVITDVSATSSFPIGHQALYDALDGGPWTTNNTVAASLVRSELPVVCASSAGATVTFTDGNTSVVFTITGSGTGYTATTFQCNFDQTIVDDLLTVGQPYMTVDWAAANWTYTANTASYPGFRGNGLTITCSPGSNAIFCGGGTTVYLVNGTTNFVSQTTPQGLAACLNLTDGAINTQTFPTAYDSSCTTQLQSPMRMDISNSNPYRVYMDDYQIFVYQFGTGSSAANLGNGWGMGVPYIPDFVAGVTSFIWSYADSKFNSSTFANNWRNTLLVSNTVLGGYYGQSVLFNGVTYGQQSMTILTLNPADADWVNSSGPPLMDAIIKFNVGSAVGTGTLIGQLWNAVYYRVNTASDTVFSFLGLTWNSFTNSQASGTLLLRQN